ncbi:MAG: hypothetical protein FJ006_08945 [Chloroflexi bacterium]|nr:hypothetical protein [Chloroflexota bacterium]
MDIIFVCKDGDLGSLLSHFMDAVTAKKAGEDAGLIVAEEALWAVATGELTSRPTLESHFKLEDIKAIGLPTDANGLLKMAGEAGVPVVACGGWTMLLGLQGKLPEGVVAEEVGPHLLKAKKIIGGF